MAENNCVVCFKSVRIYSVGECDHPVCYECSTRMRVLCRQNECPMCRHEMGKVVFTERIRPFRRLRKHYDLYDDKYHIAFENDYIRDMFETLLHYVCKKCPKGPIFNTIQALNDHMKTAHDLFCCDLCADNLKIFPFERRYYSKTELTRHKRIGDVDDRSHRGHPLCEFCKVRYVDRDELYRHLRKEHLFCHICDSEGIQHFYGMYETLREHYKQDHFLCEEGDCIKEQFTSVFPTELDLKAHKALVHCKNLRNKQAIKQARTLDLEFNLAPRNLNDRRRIPIPEYCDQEMVSHKVANNETSENNTENKMAIWEHDFPSLTNSTTYSVPKPRFAKESNKGLTINDKNFPALGSETSIRVNFTDTDSRPSTSNATESTCVSVQLNHNKGKSKSTRDQPRNGVSTPSMLSLTWVEKAKEKKPPPNKVPKSEPAEAIVKPPPLSRKNFPKLQNNVGESSVESPKKSKASDDGQKSRVNYSEAINNKSSKVDEKKSSSGGKSKEKTNESSSKDTKGHGFLLNANRKKVKMKPEMFTNLNARSSQSDSLPKQSNGSVPPSSSTKSHQETSKSKGSDTPQRSNCDSSDKKTQIMENKAEKSFNSGQVKGGKGKENVAVKISSAKKSDLQNGSDGPDRLDVVAKSGKSDAKTKKTKKKGESSAELLSNVYGSAFDLVASDDGLANVKAPPGFEKIAKPPPPPPPGIGPLSNGNTVCQSSTNSVLSFFIFKEPDHFVQRNADLSENINRSLKKGTGGTLDDFKSTSLLFQEGYISAAVFYHYCRQYINSEDFDDIFVDLVTLLPNILKQQELWVVHQSMVPSSLSISRIANCPVCFQLLKLEDTVSHYSQHSLATDVLLQHAAGIS